jgi:general secretion pathway protein L
MLLAGCGAEPNFIEIPAAAGRPAELLALAPQAGRAGGSRAVRRAGWVLAVLALVLAVAAVAIPLERQRRLLADLEAQVAQAKKEADAAQQTQKEIDHLAALDRFLVERKQAKPMRLALVDELAQILPDDTWLFRLRITGDEVQTFGYSAGASNLIGPLEASPLFQAPQFLAPLMRDQRVDAERFHIAFQVEGRPGP